MWSLFFLERAGWGSEGHPTQKCQMNPNIGVPKTVLLVNRAFVPPEKGGFWRKWRKWRIRILTNKTRALLLEPRETTKMTKMAGVPRARAWFTKSTVSWTPKIPHSRSAWGPFTVKKGPFSMKTPSWNVNIPCLLALPLIKIRARKSNPNPNF